MVWVDQRAERATSPRRSPRVMEMKTFAAPSRAEAENAAAGWWSQQTGFARIGEFVAPINTGQRRSAAARWKVTVVYVRTALPDTELDWGVSGAQSP